MLVPALVIQLDEPHVALGEPTGEQAVGGERAGVPGVLSVEIERLIRLVREIRHLGHRHLHSMCEFVLRDA